MPDKDYMKLRTGTKTIKTQRLVLRKILPTDFFSALRWFPHPDITKFTMSRSTPTKWDIFKFAVGRLRKYISKSYYNWAIVYDGRMCGYIELLPCPNIENVYSVSYKLDISLNNRGLMTEALTAVVEYAKAQGLRGLLGSCDTENIGSKRVMEKVGMTEYGDPETNNPIVYDNGTIGKRHKFRIKF